MMEFRFPKSGWVSRRYLPGGHTTLSGAGVGYVTLAVTFKIS
jgi:hypothetical protein